MSESRPIRFAKNIFDSKPAKIAGKTLLAGAVAGEAYKMWEISDDFKLAQAFDSEGLGNEALAIRRSALLRGGSSALQLVGLFSGGALAVASIGVGMGDEFIKEKASNIEKAAGIDRDLDTGTPLISSAKASEVINRYKISKETGEPLSTPKTSYKWGQYNPSDWEKPTRKNETQPMSSAASEGATTKDKPEKAQKSGLFDGTHFGTNPVPVAVAKQVESEQNTTNTDSIEAISELGTGFILHDEFHTISKGETLSGISRKLKLGRDGVAKIAAENDITDPNHIVAGAKLRIPKA